MLVLVSRKSQAQNVELDSVSKKNNGAGVSAQYVNWALVPNFSESEFQNQLHLLDRNVLYALQKLRNKIGRILISPAPGAIARTDESGKGSMHYAGMDNGKKRLSQAIDIMPLDVDLKTAYRAAKYIPEIGAVGVYPDWQPYPGLHIDLRTRKAGFEIAKWSGLMVEGQQVYRSVNEAFV